MWLKLIKSEMGRQGKQDKELGFFLGISMGSVSKLLNGVLAWRNEWITKTNHWLGLRMVSEEEWLRLKAYEFSLIELVRVREKESKP